MMTKSWVVTLALAFAATPIDAFAQDDSPVRKSGGLMDSSSKNRSMQISGFVMAPYWRGLGIGVAGRFTIPVVHNGFIPRLNDSVEIEFGPDLYYSTFYFGAFGGAFSLALPVEGRWTFHITPEFSAYGKLGLGLELIFHSFGVQVWPYPQGAAGILYKLGDGFYLRGELGNGARVGIGIDI